MSTSDLLAHGGLFCFHLLMIVWMGHQALGTSFSYRGRLARLLLVCSLVLMATVELLILLSLVTVPVSAGSVGGVVMLVSVGICVAASMVEFWPWPKAAAPVPSEA